MRISTCLSNKLLQLDIFITMLKSPIKNEIKKKTIIILVVMRSLLL